MAVTGRCRTTVRVADYLKEYNGKGTIYSISLGPEMTRISVFFVFFDTGYEYILKIFNKP